jgi:ATP-dependent DNA helicase PIF1
MEEIKLNHEQKYVFDQAENTNYNLLVCGRPGTGKSVTIRYLVEHGKKGYYLAAPTGLAALNIGGRTLHSIFRLPTSGGILDHSFNNFPIDTRTIWNIRNINALIIDEISMVRADYFDYIDRLMQHCKGNTLPFGGAQIIAIGDFYQLPPVVVGHEKVQMKQAGFESEFIFSSKVFPGNFRIVELEEVMRQKGDPEFIDLLNSTRDGSVHPNQLKPLNKQVGHPDDIRISLTSTNKEAEQVNLAELKKINKEEKVFISTKFGEWPALPAEERLTLKLGAQVMVKMNGADRPNGLKGEFLSKVVNGTLGKVVSFGDKEDSVTIEKDNGEVVTIYRKRWERKIKEKNGDKWDERIVASYEQIPLALAWAISIHKSQGMSFDKLHIDMSRVFAPGQAYVALSRARTMLGVSLEVPVTTKKFWANKDVINFFESINV